MRKASLKDQLMKWETRFRSDAESDGFASLERFIGQLTDNELVVPGMAEELVEGTVHVVRASCAYFEMDGQVERAGRLLKSQTYPESTPSGTGYNLTFDIHSRALARLVVPEGPILADLDLADLYAFPWDEYERVGFSRLYITRMDWAELTSLELQDLEAEVEEDIRYDYSEEELDLWFEPALEGIRLDVSLQDRYDEDDDC